MKKEFALMLKSIQINNPGLEQRILEAFKICDRAFFVKENPYLDAPIHVAHGQTISQPSTIARMLTLLRLEQGLDVLEVGANTGYHAALAAWLCWPGKVTSIEIFPDLAEQGRKNLNKLIKVIEAKKPAEAEKFKQIKIITGDALDRTTEIWQSKYDRIYFTAGVEATQLAEVKALGLELLKPKGLLLYPTRESWDWGALELWQKDNKLKLLFREKGYAFVPLIRKADLEELYEKRR